jgi:hypothetical protein
LTARMRSSYEYMNYLQVVQVFVRTPLFKQISTGLTQITTSDQVKIPYTLTEPEGCLSLD